MSVPLTAGLGVAETASRLAALQAALREQVAAAAARLAEEPRLEVKATLASHLYDDARTLAKLGARLAELGGAPDARPAADVTAEAEALIGAIDPVVDEASLRLLTQLLHRRRRHADELDPSLHVQRERFSEIDLPAAAVGHIEAAETAARAIADAPDRPPEFHADLARVAADSMRHAIILERVPEQAAAALEHIRADVAAHARLRERWGV